MIHKNHAGWIHIYSEDYEEESMKLLSGKYLFFSNNREYLISLLEKEITEHGFIYGKVSLVNSKGDNSSVLCLYWYDDSRKEELMLKHNQKILWKYDDDTKNSNYSNSYGHEKSYLELSYMLPYVDGHRRIFNNYYRTKFHDNRMTSDFDADKIFDEVIEELLEVFSEEYISEFKHYSLTMLSIYERHPKVTIEYLTGKVLK